MTDLSASADLAVTTGPIEGSTKVYRRLAAVPGSGVPFRRVNLSNGEHLDLYDTSGPYTDPDARIDLHSGLPPRAGVVRDRGTQLQRAREGEITAEMAFIAEREAVPAELVRGEVARGRAVIPANHNHPESEPMVIGKAFAVKTRWRSSPNGRACRLSSFAARSREAGRSSPPTTTIPRASRW